MYAAPPPQDVLKQATASLAAFIGSVNYSDSFHVAAANQAHADAGATGSVARGTPAGAAAAGTGLESSNPVFDVARMKSAVEHANDVTRAYGVVILSINIISANPMDRSLMTALASGAVASAEALSGIGKEAVLEEKGDMLGDGSVEEEDEPMEEVEKEEEDEEEK